jgi:hypothetical protein
MLGSVVAGWRLALREWPTTRGGRRILYAELRAQLDASWLSLTDEERRRLSAMIIALPVDDLPDERSALVSRLERWAVNASGSRAGRAHVLCVAGAQGDLGIVQPLDVFTSPSGGGVRFAQGADVEALVKGFEQGVWAGQQYLSERDDVDRIDSVFLYAQSIDGVFPKLRARGEVSGPSLGLGAAMALISRVLDLPLPGDVAFTGRVEPGGDLDAVTAIATKLHAAADKGIRAVYLPQANARDVPQDLSPALVVHPAQHLAEVVADVFGGTPIARGIAAWRSRVRGEADVAASPWLPERVETDHGRRILLTCVGGSDPFGQPRDRADRPTRDRAELSEGPILTVARHLRPHVVHVLYTKPAKDAQTERGRDRPNDYGEYADKVEEHLRAIDPGLTGRVFLHPLSDVDDPTDYTQLLSAMGTVVREMTRSETDGDCYFVSVSSGTPQMQATWHRLKDHGILQARLLQVREDRWAGGPGQLRIREVLLPVSLPRR